MNEIAFLEQLVRIPSLSRQEAAVAAFLVEQMAGLGFESFVDGAGNAVGMVGESGPLVVLLGHIDTVAGEVPVRFEDGKLYGRGSVDAKGPFATFVCAAARAQRAGTLRCRVVLVGAVEEEAASSKGAHFVVDNYQPQFCVIGEPSGWDRVTLGYKGRLLVHYRREQPAAHSAGELRAAPEALVDFWNQVQRHANHVNTGREKIFEQLSPSLRRVASGGDGLHDWAEATIGLRLPEGIAPETLAEQLRVTAGDASLTFEGGCLAFRSPRTTPLVSAFVRAIRGAGGQPGFLHKTGTADMNVVGPAWGCPIVAYGPGDSRLDHTPDEHIELAEYEQAIAVLAQVLGELK
ncbi:MAG: [LysW]-lysine hydrolase [Chloroflexaceae bacterium]|jgi:LysW-gamma-L-lysine carboxypeptidase|nr:[LysW]-lysine hydrolase [Chloroflexaceae bacterium]